jgi:hypothetical protein
MKKNEIIEVEVEERQLALRERSFELAQRELKPFAGTAMIPPHLRDLGSLMILDNVANKYKMDLLFLSQEMYIVKGKFSISGKLAVALINKSGYIHNKLKWEVTKNPFSVRAYADIWVDKITEDGELDLDIDGKPKRVLERTFGMSVDDVMIQANGWGRNELWVKQKELMARYRSATYFARMEMPDVLMGFHTDDEVRDMQINQPDQITAGGSINEEVVKDKQEAFTEAVVDDESNEERSGINGAVEVQETEKEEHDVVTVADEHPKETEAPVEEVKTEVKPKRATKAVTIHYEEMEARGVKRGHLAEIVRHYDLNEGNIQVFVDDMQKFVDEYYSSNPNLKPNPQNATYFERKNTLEEGNDVEAFIDEVQEKVDAESLDDLQEKDDADNYAGEVQHQVEVDNTYKVPANVTVEYSTFMMGGVKRSDLIEFCKHYRITDNGLEKFLSELPKYVEEFYQMKSTETPFDQ